MQKPKYKAGELVQWLEFGEFQISRIEQKAPNSLLYILCNDNEGEDWAALEHQLQRAGPHILLDQIVQQIDEDLDVY